MCMRKVRPSNNARHPAAAAVVFTADSMDRLAVRSLTK